MSVVTSVQADRTLMDTTRATMSRGEFLLEHVLWVYCRQASTVMDIACEAQQAPLDERAAVTLP